MTNKSYLYGFLIFHRYFLQTLNLYSLNTVSGILYLSKSAYLLICNVLFIHYLTLSQIRLHGLHIKLLLILLISYYMSLSIF